MIEIKNIKKKFKENKDTDRIVLNNISAIFNDGQINMIIGKSGSGKTLLLKCMTGLLTPEEGEIIYNGDNFLKMTKTESKNLKKNMGVLFQSSALFDSLTVFENVMFPLEMFSKKTKKERIERAKFCINKVELTDAINLYPSEISGGMKKRAAIARAIVLNPKYLFCDEPNSGLDPKTSKIIDELIKNLTKEFDMTTIIVSHDINSVINIGDNIIFIDSGTKEWQGKASEIEKSNNNKLNDFLKASGLFNVN